MWSDGKFRGRLCCNLMESLGTEHYSWFMDVLRVARELQSRVLPIFAQHVCNKRWWLEVKVQPDGTWSMKLSDSRCSNGPVLLSVCYLRLSQVFLQWLFIWHRVLDIVWRSRWQCNSQITSWSWGRVVLSPCRSWPATGMSVIHCFLHSFWLPAI